VAILHKLARDCDVLVENYLPGALAKYRMDYPSIAAMNPKIIYASITGYGQTGPYSDRAGYDVMVEACVGPRLFWKGFFLTFGFGQLEN
jgi:succinate--hydroxymethylglutarate CoA-transferase